MKDEIKEILDYLKESAIKKNLYFEIKPEKAQILLDYIINLQQENKIKDTNWESLKYYLEKLYYKDYIEEAISDDIDEKIKELESKVEIKGYQKDIKALQQENEKLKEEKDNLYLDNAMLKMEKDIYKTGYEELKDLLSLLQNGSVDNE